MTPASIAEEVQLELSDSLADLAMITTGIKTSSIWTTPNVPDGQLRILWAGRWLGGWSRAEWQARLAGFDAPAIQNLTRQWIVASFSRWEEVHRKRLIRAGDPAKAHIFGDLRHLRNDIVHHDGVSTAANAGRCLLLTRFGAGDAIFLSSDDLELIMNELAKWVERLGGTPHGHVVRDHDGRHSSR